MTTAQTTTVRTGSSLRAFAVITVAGGALAFVLAPQSPVGQQLWPAMLELDPAPSGAQIGLFMALGAIESLAFGAGLAVLLLGRGPVRRLFGPQRAGLATRQPPVGLLAAVELVAARGHAHDLGDRRVLVIEYGFHLTSILAAAVLAYALYVLASGAARPARVPCHACRIHFDRHLDVYIPKLNHSPKAALHA
jgi:hypothetical protein